MSFRREAVQIVDLAQVEPVHVAGSSRLQLKQNSKPTVKQRLAALRTLFDWPGTALFANALFGDDRP